MSTLTETIHELTRDHLVVTSRNPYTTATEYALLTQLAQAKVQGVQAVGGGDGGARLPFTAAAHDLEQSIRGTITRTTPEERRDRITAPDLHGIVQQWAEVADPEQALVFAREWSERIRGLFYTRFFVEGRCPACGESTHLEPLGDSWIEKDVICVTVETETAECHHCHTTWHGVGDMARLNEYM